jgi:phosphatidylglycerol:prolipoprotein diacylglycerol transferase
MSPVAFTLGALTIRWYGIILTLSLVVAWQVARRVAVRTGAISLHVDGQMPWIVVGSLVGARLGEVLFFEPSYYWANPGQIVAIWNGGLSILGGLVGGLLAVIWYCRHHHLNTWSYLDIAAVALPLGQAIGRWGNWFNQELYGRPTSLPWGITIDPSHRLSGYEQFNSFQPLFLYESLLNFVLFLILWQVSKRAPKFGQLVWLYLIGYGLIRFGMEFGRIDPVVMLGLFRLSQIIAILMIMVGVMGWRKIGR